MPAAVTASPAAWPAWRFEGEAPSTSSLLWTGADVFTVPARNAAAVLGRLRDDLRRERPLGGREAEFLAVADRLGVDPAALLDLWREPRAYRWTRGAHRALAEALRDPGSAPARDALLRELDGVKPFALARAIRVGEPWTFEAPLAVEPPFAIPATRWSLVGEGPVAIRGFADGALLLRSAGGDVALPLADASSEGAGLAAGPLRLYECPVVLHEGGALRVQPHAFSGSGVPEAEPVLAAGLDFQERHAPRLARALDLVRRHAPQPYEGFRHAIRVCALKPRAAGDYDDFSEPTLPGSFFASASEEPHVLADHLIHEQQHNRLSMVEELGPLFEGDEHVAAHYSPWRDRPRGLYGILHGVYVFVAVARYWQSVRRAGGAGPAVAAYALDRCVRLPRQLDVAMAVLRRGARLTALGRAVLHELTLAGEALHRAARGAGTPDDAPAFVASDDGRIEPERRAGTGPPIGVRESLEEHARRNRGPAVA